MWFASEEFTLLASTLDVHDVGARGGGSASVAVHTAGGERFEAEGVALALGFVCAVCKPVLQSPHPVPSTATSQSEVPPLHEWLDANAEVVFEFFRVSPVNRISHCNTFEIVYATLLLVGRVCA